MVTISYSGYQGSIMKRNFIIFILCFLLCSCGQNLFEQEDELVTADTADTSEEWAEIAENLESVIDNPDSSDEEVEQARVDRAAALLAKNDLSLLEMAENISESTESDDGTDNLLNLLNADANLADVDTAAEDLNSVNSSGTLTESEQITRGMANTFAVSERVLDVFDVSNDGEVASKSGSNFDDLNTLLQPNENGKTILDFASNAKDAFNQTDSLSDDQDSQIDDFVDATTELQELNNVAQNGGTFTKNGQSFTFVKDRRTSDDESNMEQALELILDF